MRVPTDSGIRHEGNLTGEVIGMSFDENALQHLMSVLTDLYSDPIMAVVREYSTNALDSHIAAGNKAPIEVHLPSDLAPVFRVKDRGTGLSPTDLHNVYSKYGYSTKRGNDDEAGMLGLGCKAGLTYTAQFTLTAVKDGVRTLATVKRGEDGAGTIVIHDTAATDEPNGVDIAVPVHSVYSFNQKAGPFFRFWPEGTVLVNGKAPEPLEGLRLDDDVILTSDVSSDYVVMGPVAYPVKRWDDEDYYHKTTPLSPIEGMRVVARVPMGSVNFTPSREALQYTQRTKETLTELAKWVEANVGRRLQDEVDACETPQEALALAVHYAAITRRAGFKLTYRNRDIPAMFNASAFFYDPNNRGRHRSPVREVNYVDAASVVTGDLAIVTGFTNKGVSGLNRTKLNVYADKHGLDVRKFVLTEERFGDEWLQDIPVISWEDVNAIKLNQGGGARRRSAIDGGYKVVIDRNCKTETVQEVDAERIVFFSPTDHIATSRYRQKDKDIVAIWNVYGDDKDVTLVMLNKNRWDKFQRENDDSAHVDEAIQADIKAFVAKLTKAEAFYLHGGSTLLERIDPNRVDDPEVKTLVQELRSVQNPQGLKARWSALTRLMERCHPYRVQDVIPALPESDLSERVEKIQTSYPLLSVLESRAAGSDITDYINALYAAQ